MRELQSSRENVVTHGARVKESAAGQEMRSCGDPHFRSAGKAFPWLPGEVACFLPLGWQPLFKASLLTPLLHPDLSTPEPPKLSPWSLSLLSLTFYIISCTLMALGITS